MSGHSKWAQIRRQKGVNDNRRGQLFTKLGREILVATREGGPDPDGNFRLRMVIQKAREANMPMDNIERSIKRAMGGGEGTTLDEVTYEGYGPGGTAIMVQTMTDNRNRTAAEVRAGFSRNGANIGEIGSVSWMFDNKGVITVSLNGKDGDEASLLAIDAGADDVQVNADDDTLDVYTDPGQLDTVRKNLEAQGFKIEQAEKQLVPKTTVSLDTRTSLQVLRIIEKLEDLDDAQNVYTNAAFSPEAMEQYGEE